MAKIDWAVTLGGTSTNGQLYSLNFNVGRSSYFDTWSGTACTFTLDNNGGQWAGVNQGDIVTVSNNYSLTTLTFYVVEVTFQDDIAANARRATITARDALGQLFQAAANDNVVTGYTSAIDQCVELMTEIAPFYPPYPPPSNPPGRAVVTDTFDDTTVGQRISDLLLTENSFYYYDGQTVEFRASAAPTAALSAFTLSTATGLVYDGLDRKFPNANYPTNVRLNSTTVGQTEAAVAGQYRRNYDRQVLLTNAAQQQAQTDWYAAVLSDDTKMYAEIRFTDSAQTVQKMSDWLDEIQNVAGKYVALTYQNPGVGVQTLNMVVEGASLSATPGQSSWVVSLSPVTVYDLFTLNSSVFGILNTNRLGW